ncbi:MAG: 6,7-dimethyl-8-ribityllumazine synthase [Hyphomicrobiaceae bacterium]
MVGFGSGAGGGPVGRIEDAHLLIIESRYYEKIADLLIEGVEAELKEHAVTYDRITVPGALEIPQVLAAACNDLVTYDGVIALGCVIRGETAHYDIVCNNANHWLMQLAIEHTLPLGNAILTVDTEAQAIARAQGGKAGKGGSATRACLRLIEIARVGFDGA